MDLSILETGNAKAALPTPHFPTPFQAVIWRNWGMVPRERIAKALKTDVATLDKQAALLGLVPDDSMCETWLERGYQTIFDRASSANIIYASPRIDVSNEVLSKLGYSN